MVTRVRAPVAVTAIALGLVAACADSRADTAAEPTVRDSAGVRIVETFPESWPPPEVWTIPDTPSVTIGVMDGDPEYTLFRVEGAIGLPDGGALIAEGDARLRYYDAAGRHVRTLDRQGEGPGEARSFSEFGRYRGDSIYVLTPGGITMGDSVVSRSPVLVLSGSGEPGRGGTIRSRGEAGPSSEAVPAVDAGVQAVLEDGSWIARGPATYVFGGLTVGQLASGRAPIYRFDPAGQAFYGVDRVWGGVFEYRPDPNNNRWDPVVGDADPPPVRARGMSIYHTDGRRFVVDVWDATPVEDWSTPAPDPPGPARSYRVHAPLEPYSDAAREAHISATAEHLVQYYVEGRDLLGRKDPDGEPRHREVIEGRKWVDSVPAVQDLRVDAAGNIWLESHRPPGLRQLQSARRYGFAVEAPSPWIVLAPDGRLLGTVVMPAGLEVFEIGADYVLGLQRDELGVQYVQRYPIRKP